MKNLIQIITILLLTSGCTVHTTHTPCRTVTSAQAQTRAQRPVVVVQRQVPPPRTVTRAPIRITARARGVRGVRNVANVRRVKNVKNVTKLKKVNKVKRDPTIRVSNKPKKPKVRKRPGKPKKDRSKSKEKGRK